MKQNTTKQSLEDSKEGLHTQVAELIWKHFEAFTKDGKYFDAHAIAEEITSNAVNERKALLDALEKSHKQLHFMCNMFCRDNDGYLKDSNKPGAWDAELDIEIETILNNAKNI